jgi:ribosomal protein L12E/L44/L45/RPP1/RPP2
MKELGMYSRVFWLLAVVFVALTSNVQSQDVFREMDQIKSEVAKLKNELNDLKSLVYEMRRVVVESATSPGRQAPEKAAPKEEKAAKKEAPLDEEQLTRIICKAVGEFFSEAESALRLSDPSAAETEMNNALQKLTRTLHGYSGTHRVSKLLNIYDGLAWSTYSAVQLRQSISGNEDFLKVLRKHKQRYIDTCPKE